MKKIKFNNVILCDFATPGANNKHTLVNTYTGDILVAELPARLHLGLFAEVVMQPGQPRDMMLTFMLGRKKIAAIQAEFPPVENQKLGVLAIPYVPFHITKDTTLRVVFSCEGFRSATGISKKISQGPIPVPNA